MGIDFSEEWNGSEETKEQQMEGEGNIKAMGGGHVLSTFYEEQKKASVCEEWQRMERWMSDTMQSLSWRSERMCSALRRLMLQGAPPPSTYHLDHLVLYFPR